MKSKKLIILISVLLIVLSIIFCGCGDLKFTYRQNKNGTYSHIIDLTLDGDFSGSGYDSTTAIEALKNGFLKRGYDVNTDVKNKHFVAVKTFLDIESLSQDILGNGLYVDNKNVKDTTNGFMDFSTISATPKLCKDNFEAIKYIIKYNILIPEGLSSADCDKVINTMFRLNCSYSFETPYKSIKTDADTVQKNDSGYYVHSWNVNNDNNIKITISTIKGAVWYAVAIIGATLIPLIIALVKIIKAKRHNKTSVVTAVGGDYGGEN